MASCPALLLSNFCLPDLLLSPISYSPHPTNNVRHALAHQNPVLTPLEFSPHLCAGDFINPDADPEATAADLDQLLQHVRELKWVLFRPLSKPLVGKATLVCWATCRH